MPTSSPVRTRQTRRPQRPVQARSHRFPRRESVVAVARSIMLVVAAVSVIGTSNYFAYLIGRKQATYEELRRHVDRVVGLMDQKQIDEALAPIIAKPRQDRLEQNTSGLTDLTTSTVNGKTTAVAPETTPNAATNHRDLRGTIHQRNSRRQRAPKAVATESFAEQPGQLTTAVTATPDAGVAGQ